MFFNFFCNRKNHDKGDGTGTYTVEPSLTETCVKRNLHTPPSIYSSLITCVKLKPVQCGNGKEIRSLSRDFFNLPKTENALPVQP